MIGTGQFTLSSRPMITRHGSLNQRDTSYAPAETVAQLACCADRVWITGERVQHRVRSAKLTSCSLRLKVRSKPLDTFIDGRFSIHFPRRSASESSA